MLPLLGAAVIVAGIAVVYANTVSGTVKKLQDDYQKVWGRAPRGRLCQDEKWLRAEIKKGRALRPGPKGKDGKDGQDGKDGEDGQDGKDDKDGEDGQDDKDGIGRDADSDYEPEGEVEGMHA